MSEPVSTESGREATRWRAPRREERGRVYLQQNALTHELLELRRIALELRAALGMGECDSESSRSRAI